MQAALAGPRVTKTEAETEKETAVEDSGECEESSPVAAPVMSAEDEEVSESAIDPSDAVVEAEENPPEAVEAAEQAEEPAPAVAPAPVASIGGRARRRARQNTGNVHSRASFAH